MYLRPGHSPVEPPNQHGTIYLSYHHTNGASVRTCCRIARLVFPEPRWSSEAGRGHSGRWSQSLPSNQHRPRRVAAGILSSSVPGCSGRGPCPQSTDPGWSHSVCLELRTTSFMHSRNIRANTFPGTDRRVIPLWFLHSERNAMPVWKLELFDYRNFRFIFKTFS